MGRIRTVLRIFVGRTDAEADLVEKTLMLRKNKDRRRRGWQGMRWLDGIINSMDLSLSKLQEKSEGQGSLACCSQWGCNEPDMTE